MAAAAGARAGGAVHADLLREEIARRGDDRRSAHHERHGHGHGHGHGSEGRHGPGPDAVLDQAFWDDWYAQQERVWSGNPNPHLVTDTAPLTPGRALDVGAGEGADAIWLAEQGWEVTAVDIAALALARGRAEAEGRGATVAGRIDWLAADITEWSPMSGAYDLVTLQFLHLTSAERAVGFARCYQAVAPGGTLLVVGHDMSDLDTTANRWPDDDRFFTAEQLAADLGDRWEVLAAESRPRTATDPEGREITIHDAVLLARRTR
jgi:SAM-dependent methyltransferase